MAAGRSRSRRKNEGKRKNLTERKRKNNDEICLVWCLLLAPAGEKNRGLASNVAMTVNP